MKNKNFNLSSKDKSLSKILEQYKLNQKVYFKLLDAFQILGNFNNEINVEIYEIIKEENNKSIKLYCTDNDDLIFVFCPVSTKKEDTYKFELTTDEGIFEYDLSFSKKYKLSKENIDLIRTKNIYDFKFGRLITNNKNFYNIFLGDDICYEIQINFKNDVIFAEDLLFELNKYPKKPNFLEYIKIFENLLKVKNIDFINVNLSSFKNFEKIGSINLENFNEDLIIRDPQKILY